MVNKLIFGEFNKINDMYRVLENFQAFTYFRFWAIMPFINKKMRRLKLIKYHCWPVIEETLDYQLRY